jgi:hypothetical protein
MSSVNVLIIEKNGEIRPLKIKEYVESDLYKKAGFKSVEGFRLQTSWAVHVEGTEHKVLLFAKSTGKAGSENKYDFPPPVDSTLFFGACVLVGMKAGQPADLTVDQWLKFYEFLFGGFEDIGSEDTELDTEDEIEAIEQSIKETTGKTVALQVTKQGYLKDDFIVDDSDDSEEYVPKPKKQSLRASKKTSKEPPKNKKAKVTTTEESSSANVAEQIEAEVDEDVPALESVAENEYLDCTSELTYEEYRT